MKILKHDESNPSRGTSLDSEYLSIALAIISLAFCFACIFAVWRIIVLVTSTPSASDIAQAFQLLPALAGSIIPEPVENATYIAAIVFCPLILTLCALKATSIEKLNVNPKAVRLFVFLSVIAAGTAISHLAWNGFAPPHPYPAPLVTAQRLAYPLLAAIFGGFLFAIVFVLHNPRWPIIKYACLAAAFVIEGYLCSYVITSTAEPGIITSTHYEIFSYPIIQDFFGAALLINQKTQYGLYAFFLRLTFSPKMSPK